MPAPAVSTTELPSTLPRNHIREQTKQLDFYCVLDPLDTPGMFCRNENFCNFLKYPIFRVVFIMFHVQKNTKFSVDIVGSEKKLINIKVRKLSILDEKE